MKFFGYCQKNIFKHQGRILQKPEDQLELTEQVNYF